MRRRAWTLLNWLWLGAIVGIACGAASALFLALLERATTLRTHHEELVYLLPAAGVIIGLIYDRWGHSIRGGNNLVIDTIHEGRSRLPLRMAPMVLVGSVLTHLFGGSAGREGTAVQMGASLADALAHRLRVAPEMRRKLLAAGMAGGFGSVFGTPIAGTLFGLEVLAIGRIEYDALVPALIASLVGDFVTRGLGIEHTAYPELPSVALSPLVFGKLVLLGVAMALATVAFVELTHRTTKLFAHRIPKLPWRMFAGGILVVAMWKVVGTSDYLGLGVPTIVRAFHDPTLPTFAFALKIAFTAVTLASGFLGGEVTPLFFVGATLGSVMARTLGFPLEFGAGMGLSAVFGAAANTPLALSLMTVELLGAHALPHVVIVTVVAYLLSGHRGIYPSQRLWRKKHGGDALPHPVPLRTYRSEPPKEGQS